MAAATERAAAAGPASLRWGSPRLPRRRSRQVRTYSEGGGRCCHGSGPRRPRRHSGAGASRWRGTGQRGAGPAWSRRPGRGRAGGGAQRTRPPWRAQGRRRRTALADDSPALRRRAVEVALRARGRGTRSSLPRAVTDALGDPDPLVVVAAHGSWPNGGRGRPSRRWHRPPPATTTPAAARPPWPHWAPSATPPGCRPCSARCRTRRRCGGGPRSRWPGSTTPG